MSVARPSKCCWEGQRVLVKVVHHIFDFAVIGFSDHLEYTLDGKFWKI